MSFCAAALPVRALTRRSERATLPAGGRGRIGRLHASCIARRGARRGAARYSSSGPPRRHGRRRSSRGSSHSSRGASSTSRRRTRRRTRSSNNRIHARRFTPKWSGCFQPLTLIDGHAARDVRVELSPLVGAADSERRRRALAVRCRRDGAVDERDIAAVAARALLDDRHVGRRLRLDRPRVAQPGCAGTRDR